MWSGPRNVSTALMRSWGNRDDTVVVDEPLYAHYLAVSGRPHPGREQVIAHHEADWRRVVEMLLGPQPPGTRIYYQKQMSHHLLPEFSALENVMLPQMIRGLARTEAMTRGSELLEYLGLGARLNHRPAELSGGEQQRVAIARAVANAPRILLADEPTGNLDIHTAEHVFHALSQLVKASGLATIIATHNMDLAARMDRRVTLREGRITEME